MTQYSFWSVQGTFSRLWNVFAVILVGFLSVLKSALST